MQHWAEGIVSNGKSVHRWASRSVLLSSLIMPFSTLSPHIHEQKIIHATVIMSLWRFHNSIHLMDMRLQGPSGWRRRKDSTRIVVTSYNCKWVRRDDIIIEWNSSCLSYVRSDLAQPNDDKRTGDESYECLCHFHDENSPSAFALRWRTEAVHKRKVGRLSLVVDDCRRRTSHE